MIKLEFLDYVELFFSRYAFGQRGLSNHTVSSYSDSIILFFRYCEEFKGIKTDRICFNNLSKQLILDYCERIELNGCSTATRNQRLTAIHALFRYIQSESPEHAALCRDVLAIRMKKAKQEPPKYLSTEAVKLMLLKPDMGLPEGIRDLALMSLLYDSAIRVQELIDLRISDVFLNDKPVIHVRGKGNKERTIPITRQTADIIRKYLSVLDDKSPQLFRNRSSNKLTRTGITYILNKYVTLVRNEFPGMININVTPHIMRHSKATHLLNAGVNLIYIRDLLGHSSVITTEIYASTNPDFLRNAIERASADVIAISGEKGSLPAKSRNIQDFLKGYRV